MLRMRAGGAACDKASSSVPSAVRNSKEPDITPASKKGGMAPRMPSLLHGPQHAFFPLSLGAHLCCGCAKCRICHRGPLSHPHPSLWHPPVHVRCISPRELSTVTCTREASTGSHSQVGCVAQLTTFVSLQEAMGGQPRGHHASGSNV